MVLAHQNLLTQLTHRQPKKLLSWSMNLTPVVRKSSWKDRGDSDEARGGFWRASVRFIL
jgi:hypothetical protein